MTNESNEPTGDPAWSDRVERQMDAIDDASHLVRTTYVLDRITSELLDFYETLHVDPDPTLIGRINGKLATIRRHTENLELHIQLVLDRLTQEQRTGHQAHARRRERQTTSDRRAGDRRHAERRATARRQGPDRREDDANGSNGTS